MDKDFDLDMALTMVGNWKHQEWSTENKVGETL